MKTLYDLLGALPDDDAEDIRAAFRKAVKTSHPDINPGDPDAAIKFRQIVRANEILIDQEQRAVYDHLLDLARLEQEAQSKQAVAAAVHKVASGTMVLAGISVVAIGGYLLFMQLSATPIAPWAEAVRKTSHSVARILARPSFAVARRPSPVDSSDMAEAGSPADAPPSADAGAASGSAVTGDPAWNIDHNDGSNNAIAYLELAPKYPAAHIESTITPFGFAQNASPRNRNAQNSIAQTGSALNGAAPPKRIEKTGNSALAPKSIRMPPPPPHAEIPMMPEPRPPRLTAVQDMSRQESPGSSAMH
jgi:curved DNA-binding protein CbpA